MSVRKATDADFEPALGSSETTVVKFYADWCGSCQLISPYYTQLSAEERFSGIQFLEINAEENPIARKWAGVHYLPFIATAKAGKLADTAVLEWGNDKGESARRLLLQMLMRFN